MNKDLFFIPMIADTIDAEETKSALEATIAEIISTGMQPGYSNGLNQFRMFFNKVLELIEKSSLEIDSFKKIEFLWEIYSMSAKKDSLELFGYRNTEKVASIPLKSAHIVHEMKGMLPAMYSFELNSGRLLWEGRIDKDDLLWAYARPGEGYRLAADTEGFLPKPTKEIVLLNGEIILRVFPALESGNIQIEVNA